MSRSHKNTPVISNNTSGMKQIANRAIRNYKEIIPNGKSYRKIFCSYDICDYSCRSPKEEYRIEMEQKIKDYIATEGCNNCWWLRDEILEKKLPETKTYDDTKKFVDFNGWEKFYYRK